MSRHVPRSARVEVTVAAPVEAVWGVVADVTRTGEWSHECHRVEWLDGATSAAPGVRFRGRNRSGPWRWTRTCEVVDVDPPRTIRWRTISTWLFVDSTDWTIALEPVATGTRIVQTFEVTRCPRWWDWLVSRLVRAHRDRTTALTDDLVRIGVTATTPAAPIRQRSGGSPPRPSR
jgi:uncharacterized protein YndB with AHSA1/START domain